MHSFEISAILQTFRLLPVCMVLISPPVLLVMVLNFQLLLLVTVSITQIIFRLGFLSVFLVMVLLLVLALLANLFLTLVSSSIIVSGLGFRKNSLVNSSLLRVWEQLPLDVTVPTDTKQNVLGQASPLWGDKKGENYVYFTSKRFSEWID